VPGELIDFTWSLPPYDFVASVQTDGNGTFITEITVPQNAPIGQILFLGASNESGAGVGKVTFTVTAEVGAQLPPEIVRVETFREGTQVFIKLFYTDPNNDAEGFGFSYYWEGWVDEEHTFSSPSDGRVTPGTIAYPFNLGCGTGSEIEIDVEGWIYDSAGLVSQTVTVHLACDEAGQPTVPPPPPDTPPPPPPSLPPDPQGQPPAAPSNVQAVEIMHEGRLSTKVSWTDNADNEVGFVIVDQNRAQEYEADPVAGVGATGSIILPFTSCFRVYAYNDYGNSPISNMVCPQPIPQPHPTPTPPRPQPTQLTPGWYRNSAPSIIYEDEEIKISWENSYIYPYQGENPLYWYVEVVYFYKGSQTYDISCAGEDEFPRAHMRGAADSGYVDAEETLCSHYPNWGTTTLKPGESFYKWIIFPEVPGTGDEISFKWEPYVSSSWVAPWSSSFDAPPPAECPEELVTLGTCVPVSRMPEGEAPILVVLVHGCCTDRNDVRKDWDSFGRLIKGKLPDSSKWEVVVWDWSKDTTELYPGPAYGKAEGQSLNLSLAIAKHTYKYIHLIGHSTGSRLIDLTGKRLVNYYNETKNDEEKPFIHLTFLDAYQPNNDDYGFLENYPDHYAEHYVNRGNPLSLDWLLTDPCLNYAFNFDITDWENADKDPLFPNSGHFWPFHWYRQSVTTSGFKFGYPLSYEGGVQTYRSLSTDYRNHRQCRLTDVGTTCETGDKAPACW